MLKIIPRQRDAFQRAETRQFHQEVIVFFESEKEAPVLVKTLLAPQNNDKDLGCLALEYS